MPEPIEFMICTADSFAGKAGTMHVTGLDLPEAQGDGVDPPVCNVVFPKGTKAIRWKDSLDWGWFLGGELIDDLDLWNYDSKFIKEYWSEGEGSQISPEPVYAYSKGLLVGPDEKPAFIFPLAGNYNPFPPYDVADRLVVRVLSPSDVEFLDESLGPLEHEIEVVEPFGNLPPLPTDPCEITPEFCEPVPDDITSICNVTKLCPDEEEMEVHTLRGRDLAAAAAQHLRIAAVALAADGGAVGRGYATSALRQARSRAQKARAFADAALRAQREVLRLLGEQGGMPRTLRYAADAGYALGRGLHSLERCLARLDASGADGLTRAWCDARLAYLHLAGAMESELRMKAWAIPAEARRPAATADAPATVSGVTTLVGP
ncbi:MAG: hypothetical protein ACJ8GN_27490 [Longimicrobiaceae bacterium]